MPDSHISFNWEVSKTGYCWEEDWQSGRERKAVILGYLRSGEKQELIQDDRYLVTDTDLEQTPAMDTCSPLEATGLFRDFAALEPSDSAIRNFANHHGMLTDGMLVLSLDGSGDEDGDVPGEPLSVWMKEIIRMNFLLQFWELIRASDKRGIEKYIGWVDFFGHKGFEFNDLQGIFETRSILGAPWLPKVLRQRDLLFPAQFMLDTLVTEQLSRQIDTTLIRDGLQRPSLRYVPRDLRTALWLQFARAIEGDKQFQQCDQCRRWYEIRSPEGGRSDKKFCSTACRARNWRQARVAAKAVSESSPHRRRQN